MAREDAVTHHHGSCADWFDALCAHMDGDLEPGDREAVCRHLEECPACARFIRSMEATRDALEALRASGESADAGPLIRECAAEVLRIVRGWGSPEPKP